MDFITVVTTEGIAITIRLNEIVSFYDEDDSTHISLSNQEYIWTKGKISEELRKFLRLMKFGITKIGEQK